MKEEDKTPDLITIVKNKCYITDDSELIKQRFSDIIDEAKVAVADLIGVSSDFDFSISCKERELFKNYCFYMWNDKTTKEFEENYISDILKLRHKHLVEVNIKDEELQ